MDKETAPLETVALMVTAKVSKDDTEAWEHFQQRVRHLAALPMYKDLDVMVTD